MKWRGFRLFLAVIVCCPVFWTGVSHAVTKRSDARVVELDGKKTSARTARTVSNATAKRVVSERGANRENAVRATTSRATTSRAARTAVSARSANKAQVARTAQNTRQSSRSAVRANTARNTANVGSVAAKGSRSAVNTLAQRSRNAVALISGDVAGMSDYCKAQYFSCMDNYCNVLDDVMGRCACSKNVKNYAKTSGAQDQANEELKDIAQQISYIGLSADEVEILFSQTQAELQMQSTQDNTQLKNDLDRIRGMLVDVKSGSASTVSDSGINMDLNGLLGFGFDSGKMEISSLFGANTSNVGSISNQRGEQLYKTAAARCKKAVLQTCQSQSVDITVVANSYDMEIDKACVAYERKLTDENENIVQTVRNAKSVLQRARLMVKQQKNVYDLRGCVTALDSCMMDDYVCGADYELCLDPTGKYIVDGKIVVGSTPGYILDEAASKKPSEKFAKNTLYGTWYYGDKYLWGATSGDGVLADYVKEYVKNTPVKQASDNIAEFLQYKIGYNEDGKNFGMCMSVLNKCQNITYDENGAYMSNNPVIVEYLLRVLVKIKRAQDKLISDYAERCVTDVASCLASNNYDSNTNIAINACRSQIYTCMSVNGNSVETPDPLAMQNWVTAMMGGDMFVGESPDDTPSMDAPDCGGQAQWNGSECVCSGVNAVYNQTTKKCEVKPLVPEGPSDEQNACVDSGGIWTGSSCSCPSAPGVVVDFNNNICACDTNKGFTGIPTVMGCACSGDSSAVQENGTWVCKSNAWVDDYEACVGNTDNPGHWVLPEGSVDYNDGVCVYCIAEETWDDINKKCLSDTSSGGVFRCPDGYQYNEATGECEQVVVESPDIDSPSDEETACTGSFGTWDENTQTCSCSLTGTILSGNACVCDTDNGFAGTQTVMGCACSDSDSSAVQEDDGTWVCKSNEQIACEKDPQNPTWVDGKCVCPASFGWYNGKCMSRGEMLCVDTGGTWADDTCKCPAGYSPDEDGRCAQLNLPSDEEIACTDSGGIWVGSSCSCPSAAGVVIDFNNNICACDTNNGFVAGTVSENGCSCSGDSSPVQENGTWVCKSNEQIACEGSGGTWTDAGCDCSSVQNAVEENGVCVESSFVPIVPEGPSDEEIACTGSYGTWDENAQTCSCSLTGTILSGNACVCDTDNGFAGTPTNSGCSCSGDLQLNSSNGKCEAIVTEEQTTCENSGGVWGTSGCDCASAKNTVESGGKCVCQDGYVRTPTGTSCVTNDEYCFDYMRHSCSATYGCGTVESGAYSDYCVHMDTYWKNCEESGGMPNMVSDEGVSMCDCSMAPGSVYLNRRTGRCEEYTFETWCTANNSSVTQHANAGLYNSDSQSCTFVNNIGGDNVFGSYRYLAWQVDGEQACSDADGLFFDQHEYQSNYYNLSVCACSGGVNELAQRDENGKCMCSATYVRDSNDPRQCVCPVGTISSGSRGDHIDGIIDALYPDYTDEYLREHYMGKDGLKIYFSTSLDTYKPVLDEENKEIKIDVGCVLEEVTGFDVSGNLIHSKWNCKDDTCMSIESHQKVCQATHGTWNASTNDCTCEASKGLIQYERLDIKYCECGGLGFEVGTYDTNTGMCACQSGRELWTFSNGEVICVPQGSICTTDDDGNNVCKCDDSKGFAKRTESCDLVTDDNGYYWCKTSVVGAELVPSYGYTCGCDVGVMADGTDGRKTCQKRAYDEASKQYCIETGGDYIETLGDWGCACPFNYGMGHDGKGGCACLDGYVEQEGWQYDYEKCVAA